MDELVTLSQDFAVDIIKLYQLMKAEHHENTLASKIMHSGTNLGLHIKELSVQKEPQSETVTIIKNDLLTTRYWLEVLKNAEYLSADVFIPLIDSCNTIENKFKEEGF